ncbi:DUF2891 domain-containing protein [Bacteroidota bacterium]
MHITYKFFALIALFLLLNSGCTVPVPSPERISISAEQASGLASPALHCIQKPYPYKPGNVLMDDSSLLAPRIDHPSFYGCFDWHSSVHGHWTLVKLLKEFPGLPEAEEIRRKLGENLSAGNLARETEFFYSEGNRTFERTYGWAWLLKLALELKTWEDPMGEELAGNIQVLADSLVRKYLDFLAVLPYPIRVGEHTNTAFGLSFAWDYADNTGQVDLKELIAERARDFYMGDQDCPLSWEPGGFDFLSPCLMEADLMARVLGDSEYRSWLEKFLPGILNPKKFELLPAEVTDRTDPKIVHLDGLNLSRAWCLFHISSKLQGAYPHLEILARQHLDASLPYIASGNYEGEHWLASFAVFALFSGN